MQVDIHVEKCTMGWEREARFKNHQVQARAGETLETIWRKLRIRDESLQRLGEMQAGQKALLPTMTARVIRKQ
jgi:hypothetical protein